MIPARTRFPSVCMFIFTGVVIHSCNGKGRGVEEGLYSMVAVENTLFWINSLGCFCHNRQMWNLVQFGQ